MNPSLFRPLEQFGRSGTEGYRVLPFRFMRWPGNEVLLVNDVGEHLFLPADAFLQFSSKALRRSHPSYVDLKAKHFLVDGTTNAPIELLATKFRTKRSFLNGFTKLHLFVVTLRCDNACSYCQVSRVTEDRQQYDMSPETADRAVSLMFRSPSRDLKVEFQGGEPLLNFDRVQSIVCEVERRNRAEGRAIDFVIASNLAPLTDEMLHFCKAHRITLSTSLDGPAPLHDANRSRRGGSSYEVTVQNIARARAVLGHDQVSALMTTTEASLQYGRKIVDEYIAQGFDSIFLRPISPYGFAVRSGAASRFAVDLFLEFYKDCLAYIIDLNRQGVDFVEVYTQILLRKILTPFATGYVDLQSPAGAAISVVAYNYDGDVYASDEARMLAEMGDRSFRLGNLHKDDFGSLFCGETARALVAASCIETLPGCSECAFAPFCGADPIRHWTTQGDPVGHRPTSDFCRKNMGIFKHLMGMLRTEDTFVRDLFCAWANHRSLRDLRSPELPC